MEMQLKNAIAAIRGQYGRVRGIFTRTSDMSRERYRRAALTGITAAASKVVSLAASLLTVRMTLRYLGAERYGMWMTISSTVTMLGFADFGMSNGIINLVADTLGRGNRKAANQAITSAFWMLTVIASIVTGLAACVYPFLNVSKLFNVHSALAMSEAGPALAVFTLCFVLNLPLGVVRGAQTGMQNGAANALWTLAGTILSLVCLIVAMHFRLGLPALIWAFSGPLVFALMVNGVVMFSGENRDLAPRFSIPEWSTCKTLLYTGGMYFILQLSFSVGMQSDNIVIAQIMGASSVALYAVPARLFNAVNSLLIMASSAIWPAYADALARGEGKWIRRTFRRVSMIGMAFTVSVALLLVVFGNRIMAVWVGSGVSVSTAVLVVFGVQCIVYAYLQPINFLLNGLSQFRVQAWCGAIMACANIGFSILFVKRFGVLGAVLGTITAQLLAQVIPLTIVARSALAKMDPKS